MKKLLVFLVSIVFIVILAGIYKFNFVNDDVYFQNEKGEYVNEYGKKIEFLWHKSDVCDENGKRYKDEEVAKKAGLKPSEFGATFCPEYKMHPTWDKNDDGINDCYDGASCSKDIDYMEPRR
jgi:cell division protein FtsI/penicillin-binding protein 2